MKQNVRRVWTSAKAFALTAVMALGFAQGAQAQAQDKDASTTVDKNFTVCPLNVDGLPEKILGITINKDGKGADGAKAIGEYLKNRGIDVVALSEDFNYHNDLISTLGDGYKVGAYRGGISSGNYNANVSFNTDGLEFLTKTSAATFMNESWTEWNQKNGKFANGSDELIRKGFRYYTVDFGNGVYVDFYTMHMDADVTEADNAARASQWEQLCNAIKTRNSGHPVIVMGDTNSRYTRDDIYGKFINNLTADYDVEDAWVKLCKGGTAPTLGDAALVIPDAEKLNSEAYKNYEIVDKVIYLNPKNATYKLEATTIDFDADNYQTTNSEGNKELLGDHVPVIVNFHVSGEVVTTFEPIAANDYWRNESALTAIGSKAYLFNVGEKKFATTNTTATETDVNNAILWNINKSDKGADRRTIAFENYRIRLKPVGFLVYKWEVGIVTGSGAGDFYFDQSVNTEGAIKFRVPGSDAGSKEVDHYFGIEKKGTSYQAQTSTVVQNDWLLISDTQKETYNKYKELYEEAKKYQDTELNNDELKKELESVLASTANSNYDRSGVDNKSLADIIEKIKEWLAGFDKNITVAKYGTICLPFDAIVPEGVTVYYATKYNSESTPNYVHLEKFDSKIMPKNTGFMVWANVTETTKFHFTYTANDKADANAMDKLYDDGNILVGTVSRINNEELSFNDYNYMLLGNKSKGVGFYRLDATSYIPANCAYIPLSIGGASKPNDTFASFDFGGATAINGVKNNADAKVVAVYGVNGELRSTVQHGLNIVKMSDGTVKKVVVK